MDGSPRIAKVTDRFLAYIIDIAPFMAGFYASVWLLVFRMGALENTIAVHKRVFLAWLALYLLYQTLGNLSGATLGKRLFGLRVTDLEGGPPGLSRSLLRAFGYVLSTPLLNLGFLWSLFQAQSRTWHDLVAGTLVVEARPKTPGAALSSALLSLIVLAGLAASNTWFYFLRPTPADREALRKAQEGLQVLAAIQEAHKAKYGDYTDDLGRLARASGDVREFRDAMREIFDPNGFVLALDMHGYMIRARALDRRRTVVDIRGP